MVRVIRALRAFWRWLRDDPNLPTISENEAANGARPKSESIESIGSVEPPLDR